MLLNIKSSLIFLSMVTSVGAQAQQYRQRSFVGAELVVNTYTVYSVAGASIFGGYRWDDFGLGSGYSIMGNERFGSNLVFNGYNFYLDGSWFYDFSPDFELKTTLGLGMFSSEITNRSSNSSANSIWVHSSVQSSVGVRLGSGIYYAINKDLNAGFSYILQTTEHAFGDSLQILSLSLNYYL